MSSLFELGNLEIGVSANIGKLKSGMEQGAREAAKGSRKIQKSLRGIKTVGRDLSSSISLPTAGLFLGAINEGRKFEKTLIGVKKTTGLSKIETDALGKSLRQMALKDLPIGVNKLGEIAEAAGQLGVKGKPALLAFTDTIAKLGQASDLHGSEAAKVLARLLAVAGEAPETVGTLGSVIVRLGNNFAATESEIAEMATRVGQATASFKVSSAESAAFGAAMKAVGINAESGGTQVGKTMREIEAAINSGGKELKAFSAVTGIAAEDMKSAFGENATDVFVKFIGGLKGIQEAGGSVTGTLDDLGLKNDRLKAVLPSLVKGYDLLTGAMTHARDELKNTTALNEEARAAFSGFNNTLAKARAALVELGIAVSNSGLLDGIASVIDGFTGMVNWLNELEPSTQKAIGVTLGLTAAIGPLLLVVGQLGLAIKGVTGLYGLALAGGAKFLGLLGTTTTVAGTTTFALNTLGRALIFVGGPLAIGAAVIGLISWIGKTEEATNANKDLIKTINGIGEASDTNNLKKVNEEIDRLTVAVLQARRNVNDLEHEFGVYHKTTGEAKDALAKVVAELVEAKKAGKKLTDQIDAQEKSTADLEKSTTRTTAAISINTKEVKSNLGAHIDLAGGIKAVIDKAKDLTNVYGEFSSAAETVDNILLDNQKSAFRLSEIKKELAQRFKNGKINAEAYGEGLKDAGVSTDDLANKSVTAQSIIQDGWQTFQSSIEGVFLSAFDSGKNFFDSLKDLAFGILKQIAAKIAATFVIRQAANALEGTQLGTYLGLAADQIGGSNIGGSNSGGSSTSSPGGNTIQAIGESLGLSGQQTQGALNGAAGVYGIYSGYQNIQNGNTVGGALQIGSGGIQAYNGYQSFTGGAPISGVYSNGLGVVGSAYGLYNNLEQGNYLGAAVDGYQLYSQGSALYSTLAGAGGFTASGGTVAAGTAALESSAGLAASFSELTTSISALPETVAVFNAAANAATLSEVAVTGTKIASFAELGAAGSSASAGAGAGAGSSAAGGASALGVAAGWAAIAIAADQILLDGKIGEEGFKIWDERKKDLKSGGIGKAIFNDINGTNIAQFVGGLFGRGSRTNEQILLDEREQLFGNQIAGEALGANGEVGFNGGNTGVFGENFGITGTGLTSQLLADGGENGNGGFFNGAQESLDGLEAALREAGFSDLRNEHGTLRVLDKEKNVDDILQVWQSYKEGLDGAVEYNAVFKTAVESGLIQPSNLFFENFAVGFGESATEARASLLTVDAAFDQLVENGMTGQDALFQSISDHYGIAIEDAAFFVEQSGVSADQWVQNFTDASGESLSALLDFNAEGITQFKTLGDVATDEANKIQADWASSIEGLGFSIDGFGSLASSAFGQVSTNGIQAANDVSSAFTTAQANASNFFENAEARAQDFNSNINSAFDNSEQVISRLEEINVSVKQSDLSNQRAAAEIERRVADNNVNPGALRVAA